jgi:superfamily II DNA or RNA helicase
VTSTTDIPQPGQAVLVRGRPATVRDVSPFTGDGPAVHLVDVEYFDGIEFPAEDTVLWECELDAEVLSGGGLPRVDDGLEPDHPERFAAFCDAIRWSSVTRLPGMTGDGVALVSPWESAVMPEPYQLYPVLKALEMPRVSLLLADDVGLGKTIEAGLILRELLQRRRIRRVLVICPASLQLQWRDELRSKFSLEFTVLNRDKTTEIQREYGMDANPWAVTPRIITSMDFLRQPDVLADFLAGSERLERGHALAWDLLIVDEAHNLAPLGFGERSDRSRMLADVAQHAEHRLFLSATPHNGFTASFSGLLEVLDPVRFRQASQLSDDERRQVELVMVRRLKSELNRRAEKAGEVPPFTRRTVERIPFNWTREEQVLVEALREYRRAGNVLVATLGIKERSVGRFVFSLLTKRLLSSPYALARTWWAHIEGYGAEGTLDEADAARRRVESQTADDLEMAQREEDVVRTGAAWLGKHEAVLSGARDSVSDALRRLGWGPEVIDEPLDPETVDESTTFPPDGKWEALRGWLSERLQNEAGFAADERAIWFTEYKDTLGYLGARLAAEGIRSPWARRLFGGSSLAERADVREAFNDAGDPVRLLLATDVAAEGLNLQTSCRYVVHYEVPWNPMRLEQRNGRVDRHGQARDVTAFHFASDEDEDTRFIDYVVRKVDQVRDDLGSVGDVIDRALEERFAEEDLEEAELERRVEQTLEHAAERLDLQDEDDLRPEELGAGASEAMVRTAKDLRIDSARLHRLLQQACEIDRGKLEEAVDGSYRLHPVPPGWERVVDGSLRLETKGGAGALPRLVFDTEALVETVGARRLFRERPDVRLMRLAHPVMRRAATTLRRRLWQPGNDLHRFTIATQPGLEAPVLIVPAMLTLVNDLREPLHAELVELAFSIDDGSLGPIDPVDGDPVALGGDELAKWHLWLEELWPDIAAAIEDHRRSTEAELDTKARGLLPGLLAEERGAQQDLFDRRIQELDEDAGEKGVERRRREIAELEEQMRQLTFDTEHRAEQEEQLRRERAQLEETEYRRVEERRERQRERLARERDRLLDETLPRRYSVARCSLMPVAVALLVPAEAP